MSIVLASAARATTGARSGQEDAFQLWPADGVARPEGESGGLLAVLADGMGGHTGGAVAGQTACSTFAEVFAAAATPYDQRLQSALDASNEALAKGVEENAALRGMGCTIVAAWMDTLGIRWASVGDSLLLLYRFPDVIRLNADHSLGSFLDEQARQNRISASEAKQHHNRNALRSALTGAKIDLIDLRSEPLELQAGDWILIASDGICSLEGDEIADVVYNFRQSTPAEMADGLIAAVVRKGVAGQDNTTVVAIRVDPAKVATDAETTRVLRGRGKEEKELRSRRIGRTGRKTSIPGRPSARPARTAIWLVAAAVFFLFFAAAILLRSLQSTTITTTPETTTSTPPAPAQWPLRSPQPQMPPIRRVQTLLGREFPPAPHRRRRTRPRRPGPDASQSPPAPQRVAPPRAAKERSDRASKGGPASHSASNPRAASSRRLLRIRKRCLQSLRHPRRPAPSLAKGRRGSAHREDQAARQGRREALAKTAGGEGGIQGRAQESTSKEPPKDVLPWGFSND